jgi:hypothetical protein
MTRRRQISRLLAITGVLCVTGASGCAFNRNIAVGQIYTLEQRDALQPNKLVYRAHVAPGFRLDAFNTIVIPPVDVSRIAKERELAESIGKAFQAHLHTQLAMILPDKSVVVSPSETSGSETLTVQCAFTEFSSGSGFMRWFLGLGIGASKVQVEGRGLDSSQRTVFEFVRKRAADGYPMGGINVTVFDDEKTLTDSVEKLAKDVASFIATL